MKLPMKHIVILVMVGLIAIFAYQTYWLVGLYSTLRTKMENDAREAVRLSDYDEMLHRLQVLRSRKDIEHGQMDVGVNVNTQTNKAQLSTQMQSTQEQQALVQADVPDKNISSMLRYAKDLMQFGLYMQQGMHSALDDMQDISPIYFDSLLTHRLDSLGLPTTHRTQLLHHYTTYKGSTRHFTDTIAALGPTHEAYADTIRLELSLTSSTAYQVMLPSYSRFILRRMAGILIASLLTLVVLSVTFWYLIRTLVKLRTLDEMKSDFTNNMTHELKTPIAVAYAANDALLNFGISQDAEKTRHYLTISQQQLQRLSGLVEQILSMSMERRKTMKLCLEDVALRGVVEAVAEEHRLKNNTRATITTDVPEGLTVHADRAHLANVVSNLVDNAVKYSPGKASVHIAAMRTPQGLIQLAVTDHGMGIPADKLRLIFDRFYRVPHGNLHEVKGYGLGLYYVKTIMEKMGGEVTVESRPGHGSTFKLTFYG